MFNTNLLAVMFQVKNDVDVLPWQLGLQIAHIVTMKKVASGLGLCLNVVRILICFIGDFIRTGVTHATVATRYFRVTLMEIFRE